GFNAACDARRQRILQGRTPNQVVAGRLAAGRKLRGTRPSGQAGPSDIAKARIIVENAKDVSQPDR
ncbi:MAG: Transposase, partial [Roseomonas sp.]|nr:Transposase [Roseomonas sp.]